MLHTKDKKRKLACSREETVSIYKACSKALCVCVLFCKSMHFPSLILNTMHLVHVTRLQALCSCVPPALALSPISCGLLSQWDFNLLSCPHMLYLTVSTGPLKSPKTALIPGPEMQSSPLCVSLDPVFLSAPPGWETVNTTTTEKETNSFPLLLISMRHIFAQNPAWSDSN